MLSRLRCAALVVATIVSAAECGLASAAAELFVANFTNDTITVFDQAANGNVAPIRKIVGGATGLSGPFAVAVDVVNNELFVANVNSITVYALAATGNIAPLRTLAGAATGLNHPLHVAFDSVNDELVVANNFDPGTVTVYSRTASGNAAPIRTLSGASTGLLFPISVTVDTASNELFVANNNGSSALSSITVYSRTANGNTGPLRTIKGANTGLINPDGTALDLVNNELVVADCKGAISAFARTSDGNVSPLRTIVGANTGLNCAIGIAVDTVNNEVEVTSYFNNSVRAYARTANGNVAPARVIAGAATGLSGPSFLAVSPGALPVAPPTIAKSFDALDIALNGSTSLSFTISNPNAAAALTGVGFADTLPAGLVVSTPNGLTGGCGAGVIAAAAGSGGVSLTGATLAASASCIFSVNVTGTTAGTKDNTTGPVTSVQGGSGGTASASVTVAPALPVSLTVGRMGNGTVTSNPPGIACGSDCTENYVIGTAVSLLATPNAGWVFSGWSGACAGTGVCMVSMPTALSVTATFTFTGAGSANSNEWVQKAYVAYYGRPADPGGLAYWASRMDAEGGSLSSIIAAFGNSAEYNQRYGGLSFSDLIDILYQQTLGRAPDPGGKQYYLDRLNAGLTNPQTIMLDLLGGATGLDALTVANRLDVANYYTAKVAAGCPYGGELTGVASLASVTSDPATVWAAKLAIETRCGP